MIGYLNRSSTSLSGLRLIMAVLLAGPGKSYKTSERFIHPWASQDTGESREMPGESQIGGDRSKEKLVIARNDAIGFCYKTAFYNATYNIMKSDFVNIRAQRFDTKNKAQAHAVPI